MRFDTRSTLLFVMQYVFWREARCDMNCQYTYQLSSHFHCSAYDGSTPLSHILVNGSVIPTVEVTKGH